MNGSDLRTDSEPAASKGSPNSDFEPEVFGKYYLVDRVAVGGMAEVFKAMSFSHGGFEKVLAIKRILSHLSANEEFVEMFVDEAKISVALQHANIVQTFDFGKIADHYYMAMEFVEGKDVKALLRKLSKRRKLLPIEFAVYIAHEVCKGLDYAHRRTGLRGDDLGIVHRDMSPSNVLLSYEGEVKITDFGIAKAAISTYNTRDGVLKGKFEYMSPEQAAGKPVDRRTDIFSTGIILYECLTGRRLFKTNSEVETLERIKACRVDPPSLLNPAIPARLDEIVLKALACDPADRYQDARSFQNDLLDFLYPATPDLTRQSFSHFLRELFHEEIERERERLEWAARRAAEMYAQAPELELEPAWEEGPPSGTLQTRPSRSPLWLAVVAALLLLAGVAFLLFRPAPAPEPPQPTTASLALRCQVPATISLDGEVVGQGAVLELHELAPGSHHLRVEAEGYAPFEQDLELDPGDELALPVVLEKLPEQAPPPPEQESSSEEQPKPRKHPSSRHRSSSRRSQASAASSPGEASSSASAEAEPPAITFQSNPPGAQVLVDGSYAGNTPLTWKAGQPGARVRVEYRLQGYEPLAFDVKLPDAGGQRSVSRSLHAVAQEPGRISVNVSSSWAHVFVDGKQVGDTPLFNFEVSPGSHEVRVVNEALGLDQGRRVEVESGETQRVYFTVD